MARRPPPAIDGAGNLSAIYLITCLVNGKQYVGQARNLRVRWQFHRSAALGKPNQSYTQKMAISLSMRKHGFENFEFTILETCDVDKLDAREVHWITVLKTLSPDGYNLTSGGVHPKRFAKEVGERISAANKGHVKTPEWRAALSEAHKGKKLSAEHRKKIGEVQKGRIQSAESNAKRSAAMKGIPRGPYSAEHCAAISAGMTEEGKLRTKAASMAPEALERNRLARIGKKRTPEQCQHFSDVQKARWAIVPKEDRAAYMLTVARQRKSWVPSEETKQKISDTLKARNAAIRHQQEEPNG